jgi:hypothetical protein
MFKRFLRLVLRKSVIATVHAVRGPGYGAHGDNQNQQWYN